MAAVVRKYKICKIAILSKKRVAIEYKKAMVKIEPNTQYDIRDTQYEIMEARYDGVSDTNNRFG